MDTRPVEAARRVKPDPPEPETEHHGNIIGFRSWTLAGHRLASRTGSDGWALGPNKAKCRISDHTAPHSACGCGLYARHVPDLPLQDGFSDHRVFGAVRL